MPQDPYPFTAPKPPVLRVHLTARASPAGDECLSSQLDGFLQEYSARQVQALVRLLLCSWSRSGGARTPEPDSSVPRQRFLEDIHPGPRTRVPLKVLNYADAPIRLLDQVTDGSPPVQLPRGLPLEVGPIELGTVEMTDQTATANRAPRVFRNHAAAGLNETELCARADHAELVGCTHVHDTTIKVHHSNLAAA